MPIELPKYEEVPCLDGINFDWSNPEVFDLIRNEVGATFSDALEKIYTEIEAHSPDDAIYLVEMLGKFYTSLYIGGLFLKTDIIVDIKLLDILNEVSGRLSESYINISVKSLKSVLEANGYNNIDIRNSDNTRVGILRPIVSILDFPKRCLSNNFFCTRDESGYRDYNVTQILTTSLLRKLNLHFNKEGYHLVRRRSAKTKPMQSMQKVYVDFARLAFAYTIIERDGTKNKEP